MVRDMRQAAGQASGLVQVMVAAALWATVGGAAQLVPVGGELTDILLGAARMALGGPILLLTAVVLGQARLASLRHLKPVQLIGFTLGSLVFQICLFRAFTLLGVTATVFLTVCLPPLLSSALTVLTGRNPLSRGAVLALGLALAGLILFAQSSSVTAQGNRATEGICLALIASGAFVLLSECARSLTLRAGPLLVAGCGLSLAGLALILVLLLFAPQAMALPDAPALPLVSLVAYLVLGPTALAYVAFCAGMARCRSAQAGLIASMIEPCLAALLAWALLGEALSSGEALGCALVFAAMLVLWRAERRSTKAPARPTAISA